MRFNRLSLFILLSQASFVFAQNQTENLDKYWFYRERLTTDFMVVGDEQGMSQPAATIFPAIKRMNWSDNTVLHGWYIGVLALEYHLITDGNYGGYDRHDTTTLNRTLTELQYAIAALLRLDDTAEIAYPFPCDSLGKIRNGFFIRDDVPRSFYSNFPGIDSLQSESTSTTNIYNSEMSQDQAYHLLFGLSLVKKFLPQGLTVNGMDIRQTAIDEAKLIVEWINRDAWLIKNPACQNKNVLRGHDASLLAHGLNEAIKFVSDSTSNYDSDVSGLATTIWGTLTSPSNPGYSNINNLHMTMLLAAIGDSWGDSTLTSLMTLAAAHRWYVYPLLLTALHDDRSSPGFIAAKDTMTVWSEFMLNEAPEDGPRNSYPDTSEHGYAVFNRFLREWTLQYTGNPFNEGGVFNGLDYMMLHNLYYTALPFKWVSVNELAENDNNFNFELFPNPSSDYVFLKIKTAKNETLHLKLLNALGKEVYQSKISETGYKLDVTNYAPGLYVVVLSNEKGKQHSGSFIRK